jgi:hypothetical protein
MSERSGCETDGHRPGFVAEGMNKKNRVVAMGQLEVALLVSCVVDAIRRRIGRSYWRHRVVCVRTCFGGEEGKGKRGRRRGDMVTTRRRRVCQRTWKRTCG